MQEDGAAEAGETDPASAAAGVLVSAVHDAVSAVDPFFITDMVDAALDSYTGR